jgi:Crp-like helix-turn-helix domain
MPSFLNYSYTKLSLGYVYKMRPNDSLILHIEDKRIYIIIEGLLIVNKCFSNREIFTIGIISIGDTILPRLGGASNHNYFYRIEAIATSYIISLDKNKHNISYKYIHQKYYFIDQYLDFKVEEILVHKTIKHRLIHLLLILSQICGIKYGNKVYLKAILSYKTLSYITGTGENTIRRLLKDLTKKNIIKYYKKRIVINDLTILGKYK